MEMRRRPRQLTFRGVKRRMERDERRALQRAEGRWFGFAGAQKLTTGDTSRATNVHLPTPGSTFRTTRKVEIYGMDSLVGVSLITGGQDAFITGAVMVCHSRAGQDWPDFLASGRKLPGTTEWDELARPRAYLPFTLVNQLLTQKVSVMPYNFWRGHRITLLADEALTMVLAVPERIPDGVELTLNWSGRYRYIRPSA